VSYRLKWALMKCRLQIIETVGRLLVKGFLQVDLVFVRNPSRWSFFPEAQNAQNILKDEDEPWASSELRKNIHTRCVPNMRIQTVAAKACISRRFFA